MPLAGPERVLRPPLSHYVWQVIAVCSTYHILANRVSTAASVRHVACRRKDCHRMSVLPHGALYSLDGVCSLTRRRLSPLIHSPLYTLDGGRLARRIVSVMRILCK